MSSSRRSHARRFMLRGQPSGFRRGGSGASRASRGRRRAANQRRRTVHDAHHRRGFQQTARVVVREYEVIADQVRLRLVASQELPQRVIHFRVGGVGVELHLIRGRVDAWAGERQTGCWGGGRSSEYARVGRGCGKLGGVSSDVTRVEA